MKFDLIIVGGSFAGLACARTAALRGLKVAVLDAHTEPGAKLRTTGIVVKEASDDFDMPAQLMRKVRGVRLYAPSGRALDLSAPGYFFQATDTAGLLRWMAAEAERAGAKLMFGAKFSDATQDDETIRIPEHGLSARYLIGADGARSRVAEIFGLGRNRHFLAGLEIECEELRGLDRRYLHCFADSKIAPGYIGWVVPGHGVTQIGTAARRGRKPDLALLIERTKQLFGVTDLRIVERRAGLIPSGGPVSRIGRGRVLLIGDAAGIVSPVTGGGIHTALHYGRRAAQLVSDYLDDRGPYPPKALASEIPRYRTKLALRRALDLAPPNLLIDAMLFTQPVRALAQRLYFHRRGGDAGTFEKWSEALARDDMTPVRETLPPPGKLHCI
ncbi:MAG TPA: NAD(P)/FAD-dependent oxidoreductase [Rhizomicrobium sp.]|jgi:flavin-dependent dehydrogenase